MLGLNDPVPEKNIGLLTLTLESPELPAYPLSFRHRGPFQLVEIYSCQLIVAPEAHARLISLLILLRQADSLVRSRSLTRFSSAFRDAFDSEGNRDRSSRHTNLHLPAMLPVKLFPRIELPFMDGLCSQ